MMLVVFPATLDRYQRDKDDKREREKTEMVNNYCN